MLLRALLSLCPWPCLPCMCAHPCTYSSVCTPGIQWLHHGLDLTIEKHSSFIYHTEQDGDLCLGLKVPSPLFLRTLKNKITSVEWVLFICFYSFLFVFWNIFFFWKIFRSVHDGVKTKKAFLFLKLAFMISYKSYNKCIK